MYKLLFKILGANGEPIYGGSGQWALPNGDTPGDWMEHQGELKCCSSGYHLVTQPLKWRQKGCRLFEAEADLTAGFHGDGSEKAAFGRVRLIREVTKDWPLLVMHADVRCFLAIQAREKDKDEDISWADLSGANLPWANLSEANLSWANLSEAKLYRAYRPYDAPTGWAPKAEGRLERVSS